MIRIAVTTARPEYAEVPVDDEVEAQRVSRENMALEEVYNATVMAEIIAAAEQVGTSTVWAEISYPGDEEIDPDGDGTTTVWDAAGDALEIVLIDGGAPRIRTLTSEEWAGAR